MENTFKIHRQIRHNLTSYLDLLSPEQLLLIPEGFRNNIYWNITHCVVTQQLICYYLSGNELLVPISLVENYKKGTFPQEEVDLDEIKSVKDFLHSTQVQMEKDYTEGKFTQYDSYSTSAGIQLNNIQEAIAFNNFHEAMHLGYIMAMKKHI